MNLREELREVKSQVDGVMQEHLSKVVYEITQKDPTMGGVMEHVQKTILAGGKRLRPAMVLKGYESAGGKNIQEILQVAAGVEYVHAFLLMHDDIMDHDDMRHGMPTLHAHLRDVGSRIFDTKCTQDYYTDFGTSTAIIFGDYLFALGNEMVYTADFPAERIVAAMCKLQKITQETGLGQFQDIAMEYTRDVQRKQILEMYESKTARYTFEGPLHIGAILAGADEGFLSELSAISAPLGIAFQIQDDILGVYGDQSKTGKAVGTDIVGGKKTLLFYEMLERCNDDQTAEMKGMMKKGEITEYEVGRFGEIAREAGALDVVQKEMREYLQNAHEALERSSLSGSMKESFQGLIGFLESREV